MAFWCYIVRCADGRYYTGHTDHLERRIGQHNAGGYCRFTSTRRPVGLVWCQEFPTRLEALEAERQISPWSRKKKEALIAGDWQALSFWARPPSERSSTSLGTNGRGSCGPVPPVPSKPEAPCHSPLVPSAVETSPPAPFVPSAVEAHPRR